MVVRIQEGRCSGKKNCSATPGSTLVVTVRSPGANPQERTIRIPVARDNSWTGSKTFVFATRIVMPVFCIALGFWVVLVRPRDPLSWLLLGLLLSFAQLLSGVHPVGSWGSAISKLAYGYAAALASSLAAFHVSFRLLLPGAAPILYCGRDRGGSGFHGL